MRVRAAIVVTLAAFAIPWAAQAETVAPPDSQSVTENAPETAPLTPPTVPVVQTEPDFPRGRISGYMFGDAYYNVTGDPVHTYSGSADRGKLGVFVKNAYLQAKNVVPRGSFFFGEITTPTFENSEEFWQYRSIEKTVVDFRGVAPSSDLGIEMKGFADAGHKVGYSVMLGDGNGQKPETNRYKRYYLSLPLNPIRDLKIEPYVDYEPGVAGADKALYKLFAGYEFKKAAIGGEILDH